MKKKIKDKFQEKFDQDLNQYFNNKEIQVLSIKKQDELKKLVSHNTPKIKKLSLWKKFTAAATSVCLIALIIIPTIVLLNKTDNPQNPPVTPPVVTPPVAPPPIYYGKAEATKIQHTLEETQEIINTNFPKYNFMFTDLTYVSSMGYYNPTNNSLLAIKIAFNESTIPYTQVEIHIIASEQFVFDDKASYTDTAEYIQTENCKIYKTISQSPFKKSQRGYIIFENHEIYINFARINNELFNKFI